ncbi:MAG TPA: MucB/RseB C-terminal domain-containing protein [Pseudomonadales bacterium]
MNKTLIAGLLTLFGSVGVVASAQAEHSEAHAWLDRMSHAQREVSYEGVFVYEQGAAMHSLRIAHAVVDGLESERLVSLDGEPREVIRKGHEISCIHPGDEKVRLDHAVPAGPFAQRFFGEPVQGLAAYQPQMGKPVRVAGRAAVSVILKAQDEWRYSHVLVLDSETGLLLRSEIVDAAGRVLERFQFTALTIGTVDAAALQPSAGGHAVPHHMAHTNDAAASTTQAWVLEWVPAEFTMAMSDVNRSLGEQAGVQMYTDGLAVFSVFVEPIQHQAPEMLMQHGATVVYSKTVMINHQPLAVTVVGEIPVLAARRLAASVRLTGDSDVQ